MCTGSLRALGLSHGASHVEIKAAFRALAKEWHPDRHHGIAKKNAEERFKQIQSAYQSLSTNYDPRMPPMNGPPTDGMGFPGRRYGTPSYNRRADEWGPNPAAKNPFKSYMDFSHPEVANARQRVQQGKKQRTLICAGVFGVGMLLVVLSANRDHRKRKSGDLIDAYYNQATRRWEPATAAMMKDPLLSTLVHLKKPEMVFQPTAASRRRPQRVQSRTADGSTAQEAYRARQQGTRT
mmetsp:Transcript_20555/g.43448  ORF Transcript_20555/g.43448 Transcript_20555/m.43448 type:complete len:237 (+) Transcript_20555:319-1029(+)